MDKMNPFFVSLALASALALTGAMAKKPADATGRCKDGSYTKSESKEGACSGHKGVKTWYGEKEAAAAKDSKGKASTPPMAEESSAAPKSRPQDRPMVQDKAMTPDKPMASKPTERTGTSNDRPANTQPTDHRTTPAIGGGAGKVWVNTNSKVYHCEKDALYGRTKEGEYMTEAQASASGARASRGKACS